MIDVIRTVALLILAVIVFAVLLYWRKNYLKRKQDQEQIDRKIKEDMLDRALSNGDGCRAQSQAQAPIEIHYDCTLPKERRAMLRLTECAESITKEYLFQQTEVVYIGEEYGRTAVFREKGRAKLYCELFPYQDAVYIRSCSRDESRLIRGKQTAFLTAKAIRLRSGDKVETQSGIFLVEFI